MSNPGVSKSLTRSEAYKIGLVPTSAAAMIASAVSRSSSANFEARRHCQRDIQPGHQHALALHRGFHGGNGFVQPVLELKLLLGYSSQVGPLGFAIFAELRGSERRSLSLRRPHNLRHRRLPCPGQRRSHQMRVAGHAY